MFLLWAGVTRSFSEISRHMVDFAVHTLSQSSEEGIAKTRPFTQRDAVKAGSVLIHGSQRSFDRSPANIMIAQLVGTAVPGPVPSVVRWGNR